MVVVCPGCGLETAAGAGPTHAYIGASPGCWARYGELLAGGWGGELAVDTYAVQHPGVEERRAVQSVAVHLVSLCAVLERGAPEQHSPALLRRAVRSRLAFTWLALPQPVGTVTVDDVVGRRAPPRAWAEDVWAAWAPFHDVVRRWADAVA